MKKTVLYQEHTKLNAKILPFAGYEMPITYPQGINSECYEVRNNVGMFDVSHMGQFKVSGIGASNYLQRIRLKLEMLSILHYAMMMVVL